MEWVFALYLGTAHTISAPLTVSQPAAGTWTTLNPVDYRGDSFASPLYYGYRVSCFPLPDSTWGVEAEMIHLKAYARTERDAAATGVHRNKTISDRIPVNSIIEAFSISHGLNMVLFNAVLRRPLGTGGSPPRMLITARIGAGPTIPHAESIIDGVSYGRYELGAVAVQAAAGIEFRITGGLAVVAEYKLTRTAQTVTVDRGMAAGIFTTHHGVAGLAWHSH